jgi:alpha-1,6-mannosyltransferase
VKTLHLTNAWHESSGGISTFYRALLEEANRQGHELRLVVPGDRTRVEPAGDYGLIYHIEAPRAPLNPAYRIIYPHRYLLPGTALQRIVNLERPDLVEVSEKYTMPYFAGLLRTGRLPGVNHRPTMVGLSCERMDENLSVYLTPRPGGQAFCDWYMKWIYFPQFDHHIAVSAHVSDELIEASRGHKVRRGIWISPMGVDCHRFTPALRTTAGRDRLRARIGAPDTATLVLYAGRLAPEKNLPLLAATMALLDRRDYWLIVAGEGVGEASLRDDIGRHGLRNVTFLGHVGSRDQLAEYYACSDIFLHPNPREPFGIAPLEAMASGLALVAPDSGGVSTYANDRNAWLAPANAVSFANTVRSVRADPEEAAQRMRQARITAEGFSWREASGRYLGLYRTIHAITNREQSCEDGAVTWSTPGDAIGRETNTHKNVLSL